MPMDLLSSLESFSGPHSTPLEPDFGFTSAPWLSAQKHKTLQTLLSSFSAAPAAPPAGGEGKAGAADAGAADAGGGGSCEELLEYQLENGKTINLCGDSEDQCIASCNSAPDLKDENAKEQEGGTMLSVMSGGEQQMLASCGRFCRLEFEYYCFPGDSTVVVRDRGRVPLADIQIGDVVMVMCGTPAKGSGDVNFTFQPVLAWLHFDPSDTATTLRIRHTLGELHATRTHLIFSRRPGSDGVPGTVMAPIMAHNIAVGDHLLAPWIDGTLAEPEVLEIEKVSKTGMYAPLVESGALIVDGTAVSCYGLPTDIVESPLYSKLLHHVSGSLGRESMHDCIHAVLLPYRLWLSALPALPSVALSKYLSDKAAAPENKEFFEFTAVRKQVPPPTLPYTWFFYVLFKSIIS